MGPTRRRSRCCGPQNERAVVERLATSVLALDYPAPLLQFLVVDDGSTDGARDALYRLAAQHPRFGVIHRPAGGLSGKSAALTAALALVTGEVVVVFDADHSPCPDCVRRPVSRPALGSWDRRASMLGMAVPVGPVEGSKTSRSTRSPPRRPRK